MSNRLKITKEFVDSVFYYSKGKLFYKKDRRMMKKDSEAGSVNNKGYRQVTIFGVKHKTHRLIFLITRGYLPETIDHIDNDTLNNWEHNLRDCNNSENMSNCRVRKDNQCGIKGVYPETNGNNFLAAISKNGIRYRLGSFKSVKLAEAAVILKRIELHGEYCNHG